MPRAKYLLALILFAPLLSAQDTNPKPTPDVLIFTNGDQLTGKLERIAGGNAVFKSDMAGELTISFDKIKELRSGSDATQFALLRKGAPIKQVSQSPEGTLVYSNGELTITPTAAPPVTVKPADVAYVIDKPDFDKAVAHRAGFGTGWNGSVTGGATIVRSSQNGTTLTAGASLVRAIPVVPYLPARNRTALNISESYGKLTTVAPPPPTEPIKTSIFHADAERDEYFSPRLYVLADASFDHNYSQGLQFQQVYGGGIGWTPLKNAKQELDIKSDVHYEHQTYIQVVPPVTVPPTPPLPPTPPVSLFGSTLGEAYHRSLPHKIVFTEVGTYLPAWTNLSDYSANITGTLAMPVFKRLSASVSATDTYLNDPAAGFQRNSFLFVTGVTYTLH